MQGQESISSGKPKVNSLQDAVKRLDDVVGSLSLLSDVVEKGATPTGMAKNEKPPYYSLYHALEELPGEINKKIDECLELIRHIQEMIN